MNNRKKEDIIVDIIYTFICVLIVISIMYSLMKVALFVLSL